MYNSFSVTQYDDDKIVKFINEMLEIGYVDLAIAVQSYHHFSVDMWDTDAYENLYVNFSNMLRLGDIVKLYIDFELYHDYVYNAYNQVISNRRNGIKPEYL